jgi:hypothetical protein
VFVVNENGWLVKTDELAVMIMKHKAKTDEEKLSQ